jgi:hypothetical protein
MENYLEITSEKIDKNLEKYQKIGYNNIVNLLRCTTILLF